jgi:hypothetical protein
VLRVFLADVVEVTELDNFVSVLFISVLVVSVVIVFELIELALLASSDGEQPITAKLTAEIPSVYSTYLFIDVGENREFIFFIMNLLLLDFLINEIKAPVRV